MYYRVDTKEVLANHSDVRASFANGDAIVLFSDIITDEDLAARGAFPLTYNKPVADVGKVAVPADVELIDGVWTQQWEVREMTAEEIQAAKPHVPASVTRRQARQALLLKGLLDQVPAKLAAVEDPVQRGMAQIEWDDSMEFNRSRPLLIQIGYALGLDDAGIDDLFIFAATL